MKGRRHAIGLAVAGSAAVLILGRGVSLLATGGIDDPLIFMPGTQPFHGIALQDAARCFDCHADYDEIAEPGFQWQGTMMAQAGRDPLFWAAMAVAAQDSIHLLGSPIAADICLRCHMPGGWLGGRSLPTNASEMRGTDFDGVSCDLCHRMYDPFFEESFLGIRESSDWGGYWDEDSLFSQNAAVATLQADRDEATALVSFNGTPLYDEDYHIVHEGYRENVSGQYFVSSEPGTKRGPFADAQPFGHDAHYSRYHKSKFMCGTCHDVSNSVLANLDFSDALAGDGQTVLPSEANPAHTYHAVERTFSEFMASAFGRDGGAPGRGEYAPDKFETMRPGNIIASCQDCHMPRVRGAGCVFSGERPDTSFEHPNSGMPQHDLTGGNLWVPYLLASALEGSPNFDPVNHELLMQGPEVLTMSMVDGLAPNANALLDTVSRARATLHRAAELEILSYDQRSGALRFRIYNNTGHKLITGYAEGRRMFANIVLYSGGEKMGEVNPYDLAAGTLRGLDEGDALSSPPLEPGETHEDRLVYEAKMSSSITGEEKSFHFLLSTGQYKDNRIPPMGYDLAEAAQRLALPAEGGEVAPGFFTAEEYEQGYDEITMTTIPGADSVVLSLYYQTTSREYIEFLRDQIRGDQNRTLPSESYVIQGEPFFDQLRAWGDTIWELWAHNKDVPGASPVLMARRSFPATDINGDGRFDAVDVQLVINAALGIPVLPFNADAASSGRVDAVDVQMVINAVLGV